SLTVPLALVFYTNRVLNPAVVVIEVLLNLYVLFINWNGVPAVLKRVFQILIGLLPGIGVGAFVVALVHPGRVKLGTYTVILPLILIQAAGWRRPIRSAWTIGLPFGTALGILYSVTTISGPPLAILFNNQGLVKNEFRAGLALVRVAESCVTAVVYYHLGLFIAESERLLLVFLPSVLGWNTAWRLCHPTTRCRNLSSGMHELRCMGRRFRALASVDRAEFGRRVLGPTALW